MFTGLIQQVGRLAEFKTTAGGARLRVHAAWPESLALGESIAVNGACLTVAAIFDDGFACDVLLETLKRTNLGEKRTGAKLNLERALRLGEALGGHFVTGHVDGTGAVRRRRPVGRDIALTIGCDRALQEGMVLKGSIAVDGVSLTITDLEPDAFSVHLVPFTRQETTLEGVKEGDLVNLETDLIGKYVARHLKHAQTKAPLTQDRLREAGF